MRTNCIFKANPRPSQHMQKGKKYLIFILILVLGVGLDQISKEMANVYLGPSCNPEYPAYDFQLDCPFDGNAFFTWTHIYNDGAFLSMGGDWPPAIRLIFLTILPGLLLIGTMVYFLRSKEAGLLEVVVFSLIAAGGVGNIIDRVLAGKVVDFMFMNLDIFNMGWGWAKTGIFNIADLYIVIGVVIYLVAMIRKWIKKDDNEANTEAEAA